jgi:ATP-dependent DNA helicase RecG
VVVIDEQHRFGVMQRATIRSKNADAQTVPHTLVMTATPIPRTLSLTLLGDMDVSTIDALPPGRQPIDTRVVGPDTAEEVYRYMAGRVAAGEQLYVVVPAVDEGEANLKAARPHARELARTWFADRRVAAAHGQLDRPNRQAIMDRFRRGEIDVLVATTVIEVGVDVPNASLMIVEHAERFGLAQLHQLRGRIGRGNRRSLCVFIAEPTTADAQQRTDAITRTAVEADPTLSGPGHALFRGRLLKQYGQALGLADVM